MKLSDIRKPIMEIWRSPTRVLNRVNAATVYSNQSLRFSPSNLLNPKKYRS